jgi:hypothetical protein
MPRLPAAPVSCPRDFSPSTSHPAVCGCVPLFNTVDALTRTTIATRARKSGTRSAGWMVRPAHVRAQHRRAPSPHDQSVLVVTPAPLPAVLRSSTLNHPDTRPRTHAHATLYPRSHPRPRGLDPAPPIHQSSAIPAEPPAAFTGCSTPLIPIQTLRNRLNHFAD